MFVFELLMEKRVFRSGGIELVYLNNTGILLLVELADGNCVDYLLIVNV